MERPQMIMKTATTVRIKTDPITGKEIEIKEDEK